MFFRKPNTNGFSLRWAGFFLAIALVPFLSGTSQASCGDYVHIVTTQPHVVPLEKQTPVTHESPVPPERLPCQGPSCSRQREQMPPLPAPVPTTPTVDHPALLSISLAILHDATAYHLLDCVSLLLSSEPFRLERPPRF